MAWQNFGNLTAGSQPVSLFDVLAAQIAQNVVVGCTASGTNAITLTPKANAPAVPSYNDYQEFSFIPFGASSGPVTVQVGGLAPMPLFFPTGAQVGSGGLQTNTSYVIMSVSSLNGGSFIVVSAVATTAATVHSTLSFIVDGGGSTLSTGVHGYVHFTAAHTINQVSLLADRSGSIAMDLWKCTYAQFDAGSTHPVVGDSIVASDPPTISTAVKFKDSALTGWNTTINIDDVIAFNITSVTTIQRITLTLGF